MQSDGFLITWDKQPLHVLSWTGAAISFVNTCHDFQKAHGKQAVGQWSITCFPVYGHVNKPVEGFTAEDLKHLKFVLEEFRMSASSSLFDRVSQVEDLFKCYLEYPPYSLYDSWRDRSYDRCKWAEYIFFNQPKFRL